MTLVTPTTEAAEDRRPVRFSFEDAKAAGALWRFNCGPAALCAVLDMTPEEIRPKLLDFEQKGYVNPGLMFDLLRFLDVKHRLVYAGDNPAAKIPSLPLGLVRVQWGGPWTAAGVPVAARYRRTHWAAIRGHQMYDVNAMYVGGWLPRDQWANELVPWLIREVVERGDGTFWPTHVISVLGRGESRP